MASSQVQPGGQQGQFLELQSASRGALINQQDLSRYRLEAAELLHDIRADEHTTPVWNKLPIRHGTALGFRRPALAECPEESQHA